MGEALGVKYVISPGLDRFPDRDEWFDTIRAYAGDLSEGERRYVDTALQEQLDKHWSAEWVLLHNLDCDQVVNVTNAYSRVEVGCDVISDWRADVHGLLVEPKCRFPELLNAIGAPSDPGYGCAVLFGELLRAIGAWPVVLYLDHWPDEFEPPPLSHVLSELRRRKALLDKPTGT